MLYSPRCQHCLEIFKLLDHCPVKDQIKYQNIHEEPIPEDYRKVLTHVPALITKDGRPLMGPEVKQWVLSMMPSEVESFDHSAFASFDGNPNNAPGLFDLESYGAPLAPPMTPELEAKINKKTTNWKKNDYQSRRSPEISRQRLFLQTRLLVVEGVHQRTRWSRFQTISWRPLRFKEDAL